MILIVPALKLSPIDTLLQHSQLPKKCIFITEVGQTPHNNFMINHLLSKRSIDSRMSGIRDCVQFALNFGHLDLTSTLSHQSPSFAPIVRDTKKILHRKHAPRKTATMPDRFKSELRNANVLSQ